MSERTCCRCGALYVSVASDRICGLCRARPAPEPQMGLPLTKRERMVTRLVAEGKINREIAFDLRLSEGTVKMYIANIFRKVGVNNRTALAVWALRETE
jgi:DNA-binding NarL/FixJ family response regulator